MAKYRVLYTDTGMEDIEIEKHVLEQGDAELFMASSIDEETLMREGMNCDGIMIEYAPITKKILDSWGKAGRVRVVARQGIGVNNIDVEAASQNGIMVANVPDYCLDEVADHTMALALCLARELFSYSKGVREGNFSELPVRPIHRLWNQNFCLYGFGNISKGVACRAKAFGFRVYAYDPYAVDRDFETYEVERMNSLVEMASIADYLSVHVPLNEGTEASVNRQVFDAMKPTAFFINTSRGSIVHEKDLIDALQKKQIYGAGLDVLETEPPDPNNPLLWMENVIITPHASWCSQEADEELRRKMAENVILALTEGRPRGFVNHKAFL